MADACVTRDLGNMAMIFDIIPTIARAKLAVVEAGTAEFDYMLAALVFDLVKKNALLHKALRNYILHADPEITRTIIDDVRAFEEYGQNYRELAHATEERMLAIVGEVAQDHIELGELLLRWQGGDEAATASR